MAGAMNSGEQRRPAVALGGRRQAGQPHGARRRDRKCDCQRDDDEPAAQGRRGVAGFGKAQPLEGEDRDEQTDLPQEPEIGVRARRGADRIAEAREHAGVEQRVRDQRCTRIDEAGAEHGGRQRAHRDALDEQQQRRDEERHDRRGEEHREERIRRAQRDRGEGRDEQRRRR
jgi:hypothetical protein